MGVQLVIMDRHAEAVKWFDWAHDLFAQHFGKDHDAAILCKERAAYASAGLGGPSTWRS